MYLYCMYIRVYLIGRYMLNAHSIVLILYLVTYPRVRIPIIPRNLWNKRMPTMGSIQVSGLPSGKLWWQVRLVNLIMIPDYLINRGKKYCWSLIEIAQVNIYTGGKYESVSTGWTRKILRAYLFGWVHREFQSHSRKKKLRLPGFEPMTSTVQTYFHTLGTGFGKNYKNVSSGVLILGCSL